MGSSFTTGQRVIESVAGLVLLFIVWSVASLSDLLPASIVPGPLAVIRAFGAEMASGTLLSDTCGTGGKALLSLAVGSLLGVPLGICVGFLERTRRIIAGPLDFFRSLPAIALFPVAFRIAGPGSGGAVALAAFSTGLVVFSYTCAAIRQSRVARRQAVWQMGACRAALIREVIVPEIMPAVVGGLRVGWSISVVVCSVVEMLFLAEGGLGVSLLQQYSYRRIPQLWSSIIALGLLGYCGNVLLECLEGIYAHWQGR